MASDDRHDCKQQRVPRDRRELGTALERVEQIVARTIGLLRLTGKGEREPALGESADLLRVQIVERGNREAGLLEGSRIEAGDPRGDQHAGPRKASPQSDDFLDHRAAARWREDLVEAIHDQQAWSVPKLGLKRGTVEAEALSLPGVRQIAEQVLAFPFRLAREQVAQLNEDGPGALQRQPPVVGRLVRPRQRVQQPQQHETGERRLSSSGVAEEHELPRVGAGEELERREPLLPLPPRPQRLEQPLLLLGIETLLLEVVARQRDGGTATPAELRDEDLRELGALDLEIERPRSGERREVDGFPSCPTPLVVREAIDLRRAWHGRRRASDASPLPVVDGPYEPPRELFGGGPPDPRHVLVQYPRAKGLLLLRIAVATPEHGGDGKVVGRDEDQPVLPCLLRGVVLLLGDRRAVPIGDEAVQVAHQTHKEVTLACLVDAEVLRQTRPGTEILHATHHHAVQFTQAPEHLGAMRLEILERRAQEDLHACHPTVDRAPDSPGLMMPE